MSYKGTDIENKAMEPPIPDLYVKEYTKFLRFVESETDADALGQAQVKFSQLLRVMATAKVHIPQSWAEAANAAGDKMSRIRHAEFTRRMS